MTTTTRIEAVSPHAKAVIKDGAVESIVLHGNLKKGDLAEGERYHLRFNSLEDLRDALKDYQACAWWIQEELRGRPTVGPPDCDGADIEGFMPL